jgi:hypothetical protein
MKTLNPLKVPFGKGRFTRIRDVRYRQWDDAFEVVFDDGLSFLEPHETIRKANKISRAAVITKVEADHELRSGFFVRYDTGEIAEVSWAFIRELPPKKKTKIRKSTVEALREARVRDQGKPSLTHAQVKRRYGLK